MPNHTSLYANTAVRHPAGPGDPHRRRQLHRLDLQNCDDAVLLFMHRRTRPTPSPAPTRSNWRCRSRTTTRHYTAVANADLTNYVTGTNVGTVAVIDAPAEDSLVVVGRLPRQQAVRPRRRQLRRHAPHRHAGLGGGPSRPLCAQPVNSYT